MLHPRDQDPQAEARGVPEPLNEPCHARLVRPLRPLDAYVEEVVCEAVFRYQLQQPLADAPQPPRYYVARQGRDPDEILLRRLQSFTPEVYPLSQCRVSARDGVLDRATEGRGMILQVARLAWVHAAAVDVVGGYYITHRHAAGLRYHVALDGQHWAVTTVHLLWRA